MSNDKSPACPHRHTCTCHMCMQHAHHVHAHAYTGGYIFLIERTTLWERIERYTHTRHTVTHTHTLESVERYRTRHTSLRGTGFGFCIRYSYFIFVRTGTPVQTARLSTSTRQIDIQLPTSSFPPILAVLTHGHTPSSGADGICSELTARRTNQALRAPANWPHGRESGMRFAEQQYT